ncbi:MAG TPA: DUF2946 family protein [Burkholderiales bacterium]|jgi:hypothetical protein
MDDIVAQAMRKWPDVPDVYNWLRLDERGRWRVRARDYERSGRFETIGNQAVVEFIGRNYQADDQGRWYFQNGPQRVFVGLACAPWVFRFTADAMPVTHTGRIAARADAVLIDEAQTPILITDLGPGALSDQDFAPFLGTLTDAQGKALDDPAFEAWLAAPAADTVFCAAAGQRLPLAAVTRATLAARYHFNPDPQPAAGAPDCA